MAFNLGTGAQLALLAARPTVQKQKIATTISFGDGDGTGATDTINDSGSGLAAVFDVDDHILVVGGTNNGKLVKALTVAAGKIEVVAGSFTTESAGSPICLVMISSGSFAEVFKNCRIVIRSSTRPTDVDAVESGTALCLMTKNGGAFTVGESTNGINFGDLSGTTLQRAIDPATGVAEVVKGIGLANGTAGWGRIYANGQADGGGASSIHMDGVCSTSGSDINLSTGLTISVGAYSEVTNVAFTVEGV